MKQKNRIRLFGSVIAVTMLLAACGSSGGDGGNAPVQPVNTWNHAKWDSAAWGP